MRIISQDRKTSVNFENCVLEINDNCIHAIYPNRTYLIGTYSNQAIAIDVLEDIHKAYAPVNIISTNMSLEQVTEFIGSQNLATKCIEMNEPHMGITTYDDKVYYMP